MTRTLRPAAIAAAVLFLAACGGGPVQPDWQNNAHQSLNAFSSAYLKGDTRIAGMEFTRARNELSRTGRFDLVARAELVRCAAQVASLELDDCPGFAKLAAEAGNAERAYAAFLLGKTGDTALLPEQYRSVASGTADGLAAIEPPLPRLIAAGVLLRSGRLTPAGIAVAVETASAQGWRRALLAWLEIQAHQAEAGGDATTAERARRRAALLTGER